MSKRSSMEGVIVVVLLLACSLIPSSAYPLCASNLGMYMSYLVGALWNSCPDGNSHVFCMQLRAKAFSLWASHVSCIKHREYDIHLQSEEYYSSLWRCLLISLLRIYNFISLCTITCFMYAPQSQRLSLPLSIMYNSLSGFWEDDIDENESHSLSKVKIGGYLCDDAYWWKKLLVWMMQSHLGRLEQTWHSAQHRSTQQMDAAVLKMILPWVPHSSLWTSQMPIVQLWSSRSFVQWAQLHPSWDDHLIEESRQCRQKGKCIVKVRMSWR